LRGEKGKPDPYETRKQYFCKLVDLAKKHKREPDFFVRYYILETMLSIQFAMSISEKELRDWIQIAKETPYIYVDERLDEFLSRFGKWKEKIATLEKKAREGA